MARVVNTIPVKHAYQRDVVLKSGMNFSNSLPAGIFPCRISPDTWPASEQSRDSRHVREVDTLWEAMLCRSTCNRGT